MSVQLLAVSTSSQSSVRVGQGACSCMKPGCGEVVTGIHSRFHLKAPWHSVEKANAKCPVPHAWQMLSRLMKSNLCLKRSSTGCTEGDALQVLSLGTGWQHSVVFNRDWQVAGSVRCHGGPGVKLCVRVKCGSFQEPRALNTHCFGRGQCWGIGLRCASAGPAPAGSADARQCLVVRLRGVSPSPGHPLLQGRVSSPLICICFPWKTLPRGKFWRAA